MASPATDKNMEACGHNGKINATNECCYAGIAYSEGAIVKQGATSMHCVQNGSPDVSWNSLSIN